MTDDVLKWAYTNQITFTWDEYQFEHTLVGRVPHQGVPRVVKYKRKKRTAKSKRHGIGFVMDSSELLDSGGIQQYQNNIKGIVACILETVYLNSIYAMLESQHLQMREHMAVGVSQSSIFNDFAREIEDYASLAKDVQGTTETIMRKMKLLDMVGAQRTFLITSPESGIYLSQLKTYEKPNPLYYTQGPEAQIAKPVKFYDYVLETSNGPINVYTARDLRVEERGNFVKPLLSEPWISEYFVHSAYDFKHWNLFNGFNSPDNTVNFNTELRDVLVYSPRQDDLVRIPFKKSSRFSQFATESFLKWALSKGPSGKGSMSQWKEKHFYPSSPGTKYAGDHRYAADSFAFPDEDSYHRFAPSCLYWKRETAQPQIATHFGQFDSTAMSDQLMRCIGSTIAASGSWSGNTLQKWKMVVLQLLDQLEQAPYDQAFFKAVIEENYTANIDTSNEFAGIKNNRTGERQWLGATSGVSGILSLPPRPPGMKTPTPPGFTGYAGLKELAKFADNSEDSGWGELPKAARAAIALIKDVLAVGDNCLISEDTKAEHRPINFLEDGSEGKIAAFVANLVHTDRSPLFLTSVTSGNVPPDVVSTRPANISSIILPGGKEFTITSEAPSDEYTVAISRVGQQYPVYVTGKGSGLFFHAAAGQEIKTFSALAKKGTQNSLINTIGNIRQLRDKLLDEGSLSEGEAFVEPLISNYMDLIQKDPTDANTENLVAGVGRYISEYVASDMATKEKFLKSKKILSNIVNAAKPDASKKRYSPSFKNIKAKGEEYLNTDDNSSPADETFEVVSDNNSFSKGLSDALDNVAARQDTNNQYQNIAESADSLINVCIAALSYSRSKWPSGNDADALLLFNSADNRNNIAITSDKAKELYLCDDIGKFKKNNLVEAVCNYQGGDDTLTKLSESASEHLLDLTKSRAVTKRAFGNIVTRQGANLESIGADIIGEVSGVSYMTSLFYTTGIKRYIDHAPTNETIYVSPGSEETGFMYASSYINPASKTLLPYLGFIASDAEKQFVPVKTYEGTLKHVQDYLASPKNSKISSKRDRLGGVRSRERQRREHLSELIETRMDIEQEESIGNPFDVIPPRTPAPSLEQSVFRRLESTPRKTYDYPKDYTGVKGIGTTGLNISEKTRALDTSNYKEHMAAASKIKNPIVKVLTMMFLSSLSLRSGKTDPWANLEECNILTPISFIGIRSQIQHAMEHWIMGEPGYKMGVNVYGHNQFIVGVDATSMMIYGNLGYYHASVITDADRIVLLPFIRPRCYVCGSEARFVTSQNQLNLKGHMRPDIISLGISAEETGLDAGIPILGWYKYPDMNRMLEAPQFTPGYSGYMEFRYRFPAQTTNISTGYGFKGNRSYKDMLAKLPPVSFRGRYVTAEPDGFGGAKMTKEHHGRGHRAGGQHRGCARVWNGKSSYFRPLEDNR